MSITPLPFNKKKIKSRKVEIVPAESHTLCVVLLKEKPLFKSHVFIYLFIVFFTI